MRRALGAASAVAMMVSGIVLMEGTSSAGVAGLGCGSVITTNTTLFNNIGPCPGDGLIVAADNITLNLNRRRVIGNGVPGNDSVGIRLRNVRNVTVTGGTVERFNAGVVVQRGNSNRVRFLTVQDNVGNLAGLGEWGDGIVAFSTVNAQITGNVVQRNGPFTGIGVVTIVTDAGAVGPAATGNLVSGNQVRDNNIVERCTPQAIAMEFCTPEELGDPTFNENFGIKIEGPNARFNRVVSNNISGSGIHGIGVTPTCIIFNPPDIDCDGPNNDGGPNTDNLISRNNSSGNGVSPFGPSGGGSGIYIFQVGVSIPPTRTTIESNQANNNNLNGINIDCGSTDNTVVSNQALGNNTNGNPTATDGRDQNVPPCPTAPPPCDSNTWRNNVFGTVNHPCVRGSNAATASSAAEGAVETSTFGRTAGSRVSA